MDATKQNQTITLADGRKLGFCDYGAPGGEAVFYFQGSGSSRLEHPLPENLLTRLNIRFISVDRPGIGLSDFQEDRCLLDWAKDIAQLADYYKIERFFVAGHSAGGPHALVCAHQLPERVKAGVAISSVAPMSRPNAYKGMPVMNQILARSARHLPIFVRLVRWMIRRMIMDDFEKATRQLMSSIPETDKAILDDPQVAVCFVGAIREGLRPGSRGVALDDVLINQAWGFDIAEIKPRIDIWHGDVDVNVPIGAARYLMENLPHSRGTLVPGAGHFFFLNHWEEILYKLVNE